MLYIFIGFIPENNIETVYLKFCTSKYKFRQVGNLQVVVLSFVKRLSDPYEVGSTFYE